MRGPKDRGFSCSLDFLTEVDFIPFLPHQPFVSFSECRDVHRIKDVLEDIMS